MPEDEGFTVDAIVIDDSGTFRKQMRRAMENDMSFDSVSTLGGSENDIRAARKHIEGKISGSKPLAVIIDYYLGCEINGASLAKELNHSPFRSQMKIILCSAHDKFTTGEIPDSLFGLVDGVVCKETCMNDRVREFKNVIFKCVLPYTPHCISKYTFNKMFFPKQLNVINKEMNESFRNDSVMNRRAFVKLTDIAESFDMIPVQYNLNQFKLTDLSEHDWNMCVMNMRNIM